ncbi:hypothetical protein KFE25_005107 [Diacronema lutheri]|uniref:RNase H type-1 domain-containing protein n=1 Tax=Diacronema lutheri TaxID=2081491 RepID=A0A8J6C7Q1_DIALT|nr:hypothetical protein KFE25_005107 [Diacronema lutheri]
MARNDADPAALAALELFFDGGAQPNPGPSGAGALLLGPRGETVWEGSCYVGARATNNEAEYAALIRGLAQARELGAGTLVVKGDSQLVIRQMRGEYRVKALNLRPLHDEARDLARAFASVTYVHVARALNARADALATAGIALGGGVAAVPMYGGGAGAVAAPAVATAAAAPPPSSNKRTRSDERRELAPARRARP